MNLRELKDRLEELVSTYFAGAKVVWGRADSVRPQSPVICLNMGDVQRPYQPIRQSVGGTPIDCYPSQTRLQVDLFTKGSKRPTIEGHTSAMENTAMSDLLEFLNFVNSGYASDWCEENDISIMANIVRDTTQLINDTSWDFRATVELEIGFTETAVGYAAMNYDGKQPYHSNGVPKYDAEGYELNESGDRVPDATPLPTDDEGKLVYPELIPTPSGGGSQDLADQSMGWFEEVQTPIREEESNNV